MEARLLKQNVLNGPEFMSIENDKLTVNWIDLGEGIWGDYNPNRPDDRHMLRFDVYCKRTPTSAWEPVEDASYCTCTEADTPEDLLEKALWIIFNRYNEVIDDYMNGVSVKGKLILKPAGIREKLIAVSPDRRRYWKGNDYGKNSL